jgi:hypothetical protein
LLAKWLLVMAGVLLGIKKPKFLQSVGEDALFLLAA